ncbi:hypothetical protein SFC65_19775 [Priestia filamentosa]|uniref:hypothetical protein n=1 Tax=Priestia filamentosa TaxID=1402861 RepID=UPI00398263C9
MKIVKNFEERLNLLNNQNFEERIILRDEILTMIDAISQRIGWMVIEELEECETKYGSPEPKKIQSSTNLQIVDLLATEKGLTSIEDWAEYARTLKEKLKRLDCLPF